MASQIKFSIVHDGEVVVRSARDTIAYFNDPTSEGEEQVIEYDLLDLYGKEYDPKRRYVTKDHFDDLLKQRREILELYKLDCEWRDYRASKKYTGFETDDKGFIRYGDGLSQSNISFI